MKNYAILKYFSFYVAKSNFRKTPALISKYKFRVSVKKFLNGIY